MPAGSAAQFTLTRGRSFRSLDQIVEERVKPLFRCLRPPLVDSVNDDAVSSFAKTFQNRAYLTNWVSARENAGERVVADRFVLGQIKNGQLNIERQSMGGGCLPGCTDGRHQQNRRLLLGELDL